MAEFNVPNRTIFHGDNLKFLRGINSDSVDLVYLDPPFNKNRRFFAPTASKKDKAKKRVFDDVWLASEHKDKIVEYLDKASKENEELCDWLRSVKSIDPDRQERNYCYLVYMSIRLLECRRILKPTGSLFLHCDDTMSHWLKITLDCIFDEGNFRNEITWRRTSATKGDAKHRAGRIVDSIFWYSKTDECKFKGFYEGKGELDLLEFSLTVNGKPAKDNGPIMRSRTRDLPASLDYEWRGIRPEYGWDVTKDKLERFYQEGKVTITTKRGVKVARRAITYDDYPGKKLGDLWTGLYLSKSELTNYATQKPVKLLQRIILATTDEKDVVVDPFCGCATTCEAADNENRLWVGMDIESGAREEIDRRLPDLGRDDIHFTATEPVRTDGNKPSRESRWVYILKDESEDEWHKVGIAKDPRSRENSYRTGKRRRESVRFVYKVQTEKFRELEQHLIDKFENDHEWLKASVADIKKAIRAFLKRGSRKR